MSSINTSLSALHAAVERLNLSAHNTANANTDGFKTLEATLKEGKEGGVVVSIEESGEEAAAYQVAGSGAVEPSNADYVDEAVEQSIVEELFLANLEALKAADEADESILDIMA